MKQPVPSYPDANFTMRLTYGNVKSYSPRDAVHYDYYTTTDGILEKENPEDREFVVPAKLKELIQKKDFGRYAMADGTMPVCIALDIRYVLFILDKLGNCSHLIKEMNIIE
jgi:hypothetical protein